MQIHCNISLIDDTLGAWSETIGRDLEGYRNHVYRMVNFTYAMGEFDDDTKRKIAIAGCFHDIGIWPSRTLDYLEPSASRAEKFLVENGMENWQPGIREMICQHHKLRTYKYDPLIEAFRQGDLVDFSLDFSTADFPARSSVK